MDLLKEEKRLVEKLVKAREGAERKAQYLAKIRKSFTLAQREVKAASVRVRKIRKQVRMQLAVSEPLEYPDENTKIPLNEESAKLVDKIQKSTELADVEVEEKTD